MFSNISLLKVCQLSGSDRHLWQTWRKADPNLFSPYFSLAYVEAVEQVRPGLSILRFERAGRPIAFLPIRSGLLGTARPIAGPMDDIHGLICAPETAIDLQASALKAKLAAYAFSAVPYTQSRHGLIGQSGDGNHILDLSKGYQAYIHNRSEVSSNFRRVYGRVSKVLKSQNCQVCHQIDDLSAFNRLITLKRQALKEARHFDIFRLNWPRKLLITLLDAPSNSAKGILSTLNIDGELAAICVCMRSEHVLHYWFPAYEPKFKQYNPGLALLFSLAEWASGQDIQNIHLGLGNVQYKRLMASYLMPVRQGTLALSKPQKLATDFSRWSMAIESKGRLCNLPAKFVRKYDRVALSGTLKA